VVSAVGLLSALGVVLARNLVHAALFLVAFFFGVACQFVLLEAEFLAAMQVLVYIGAVSILILFGIMLTPDIGGREPAGPRWAGKGLATVVGLAVLGTLVLAAARGTVGAGSEPWAEVSARPGGVNPALDGPEPARAAAVVDMPRAIGVELMTRQLIAFELAGLMLTAALVGAIALARADLPGAERAPIETREPAGISARERA
jgi:NADH-quinone oxidoreductase subunit J